MEDSNVETTKNKGSKIVLIFIALIIVAALVGGFIYLSSKTKPDTIFTSKVNKMIDNFGGVSTEDSTLNRTISISGNVETSNEQYKEMAELLRKNLNSNGWDGRWYKRAYTDDGDILGSIENEECRIDSIAQSWSVISGAGDNDKKFISMESLETT